MHEQTHTKKIKIHKYDHIDRAHKVLKAKRFLASLLMHLYEHMHVSQNSSVHHAPPPRLLSQTDVLIGEVRLMLSE